MTTDQSNCFLTPSQRASAFFIAIWLAYWLVLRKYFLMFCYIIFTKSNFFSSSRILNIDYVDGVALLTSISWSVSFLYGLNKANRHKTYQRLG
jgi:hypothetical protein